MEEGLCSKWNIEVLPELWFKNVFNVLVKRWQRFFAFIILHFTFSLFCISTPEDSLTNFLPNIPYSVYKWPKITNFRFLSPICINGVDNFKVRWFLPIMLTLIVNLPHMLVYKVVSSDIDRPNIWICKPVIVTANKLFLLKLHWFPYLFLSLCYLGLSSLFILNLLGIEGICCLTLIPIVFLKKLND